MTNRYELDLDRAWSRVLPELRHDSIPDIIHYADMVHGWETVRSDVEARLNGPRYSPQVALVAEVAKNTFVSRPIALLNIYDRIVYEAILDEIAPHIDLVIPEEVFSARLKKKGKSKSLVRHQVRDWVRFESAGRDLYETYGYSFMLTTDVTSYFEYVEISVLMSDLRTLPGARPEVVQLLSELLNGLQRSSDIWGLPQGPAASSVLGNFYLLPVDSVLRQHPVRFVRYQDDIKIFANSRSHLRKALKDVVRVLRARRLNLATSKTRMSQGDEILEEFEDTRKSAIQYGLEIRDQRVEADIVAMFDDAVSQNPVNSRDIRFTVYRLQRLGNPHAVSWVLANLQEVPYLAEILVPYLSRMWGQSTNIQPLVVAYLMDQDRNISPYLELHLIRMLGQVGAIDDATYQCLWSVARDQNKVSFVRQHVLMSIASHIRPGDIPILQAIFQTTTDPSLRRAVLVAHSKAGGADTSWLSEVGRTDTTLALTTDYLRSNPDLGQF